MFINFAAFQVSWFAVVLSAAAGLPWIGVLVITATILLHLGTARRPGNEFALVTACGAIGAAWDSVLVAAGWAAYPSRMIVPFAAPYGSSRCGCCSPRRSMCRSRGSRGALRSQCCSVRWAGRSRIHGRKARRIQLVNMPAALLALGVGWAALMPVLLRLAERLEGMKSAPAGQQGWILD
ncbi:MAG: DUF2878 family protein [Woeseiaceae bacterium]|nr:DUF2878 family protein [Woeseiaceae bacterium]